MGDQFFHDYYYYCYYYCYYYYYYYYYYSLACQGIHRTATTMAKAARAAQNNRINGRKQCYKKKY